MLLIVDCVRRQAAEDNAAPEEITMSVRAAILDEMRRIAGEQKKTLGSLDDDTPLASTGLDSLGFAVLVARLEEQLNVDPFAASDEIDLPVTVGDLVHFYEGALV